VGRRDCRRAGRSGLTLIEAIGALVLLTVAVPSLMLAVRESHLRRVTPIMMSRARWIAGEKLEELLADRHSATRGYAYLVNGNYPDEDPVPGMPGFVRSTEITESDHTLSGAGTGCKTVAVTVSWRDPLRGTRSLTLSTVVASTQ